MPVGRAQVLLEGDCVMAVLRLRLPVVMDLRLWGVRVQIIMIVLLLVVIEMVYGQVRLDVRNCESRPVHMLRA